MHYLGMSEELLRDYHRSRSPHHPENGGTDWFAMVIDWECARLTKPNKPMGARETMERYYPGLRNNIEPILNKLGL